MDVILDLHIYLEARTSRVNRELTNYLIMDNTNQATPSTNNQSDATAFLNATLSGITDHEVYSRSSQMAGSSSVGIYFKLV